MQIPFRLFPVCLILVFLLMLLAVSPNAFALGPKGDVYLGYSRTANDPFYPGTGGLNGWEGAFHLHMKPFLGIEGDASHYGLGAGSTVPRSTVVLVGPRLTAGAARFKLFVHALAGGEHSANSSGVSGGSFAVAVGGGLDVPVAPFFAWRVAADYLNATSQSPGTSKHARFSTGLVFRF